MSSATEWLLADSDERLVDLSDRLLLLPTQQAGRRLREALATAMAKRGGGLFPPRVATPAVMLAGATWATACATSPNFRATNQ